MHTQTLLDSIIPKTARFALAPASGENGTRPAPTLRSQPNIWLSSNDKEEVEVTRRRTGDGGPRERADAPSRRQDQPSDAGGSGRSGGGGFGGGDLGGGFSGGGGGGSQTPIGAIIALLLKLPPPVLIALVILACCVGGVYLYLGGGSTPPSLSDQSGVVPVITQVPLQVPTVVAIRQTPIPPPATVPNVPSGAVTAASTNGQRWLVMLYQDAKDRVLDQDIFTDLNEAERAGSTDRVRIVAQIDRYRGPQTGAQWQSAKRFLVTRDSDLHTVHSQQLQDIGQVNDADPQTLIDFVTWAVQTYPADKYVLIMSDHGMGWPGGWTDPAVESSATSNRGVPLASAIGNLMYLNDIDKALTTIRSQTGIDKFELIGMDACLMSQMEVLDSLAPHARYAVLSQETEPALGWAYTGFLDALNANPDMSGADLARDIVQTYITDDQRIVDDQARAEFVQRGSSLGGLFGASAVPSADQVAGEIESSVTLSALDLQSFPTLMQSVNNLAFSLQQANSKAISQSRSYAQSFTSVFGDYAPSYIDLGNFVQLLNSSNTNASVSAASQQVQAALKNVVIAEKHGSDKPGATGISIYFPNSQLYRNPAGGPASYTAIANRFAADSLWDDFLTFFYTGKQFEQTAGSVAVPSRGTTITAPNAGSVQISPLTLSAKATAPGNPVTLSADITGQNIGYLKLFVGFYDRASNSINVTDQDYLQSSQTREASGIFYPVWPDNRFSVKFKWDPIVFAINDGNKSVPALFSPQTYGASAADAVYTVDGIYTPAYGSGARGARLYFRDKILRQVFTFTANDPSGAPREVITKPGDTFTLLEKWIDLDSNGKPIRTATQTGATLTFGDQPFRWRDLDAAAGDYVLGFTVEDLDGNRTESYSRITVQ